MAPGEGESTIAYGVPTAWLADPARAWPVTIDPSLFSHSPTDTYVAEGYPNTGLWSLGELLSGNSPRRRYLQVAGHLPPSSGNIPAG